MRKVSYLKPSSKTDWKRKKITISKPEVTIELSIWKKGNVEHIERKEQKTIFAFIK